MAKNRRFERSMVRVRNRIEKKGVKLAFNAIKEQYKTIFDLVGVYSPQFILDNINVPEKPIADFMEKYYPMFAPIGVMYRNEALKQKNEEDTFFLNVYEEELRHFALTETGARITSITATTEKFIRGAVESAIQEGVELGLSINDISKIIRKNLTDSLGDIGKSRSKMIAQTEMTTGSNQAAVKAMDSTGLLWRKFWSASGDSRVRESHQFAEQNYPNGIPRHEAFSMGNGNFMMHPGDPNGAPEEVINCYTGDMNIKSAIVGAQKLFYSGNMVEIITRGGKRLTVTPNHYILSKNGFVKACDINKGDDLLCNTENVKAIPGILRRSNNINNEKPTISEVFDSLVVKFVSKTVPVVGLDFDGDGKNGQGNINIVNVNRKLNLNSELFFKDIGNFSFKKSNSKSFLVKRFCRFYLGLSRMRTTPNRFMSFFNLISSFFRGHLRPFKFFGLGLTSHNYTLFRKMPMKRSSWNPRLIRDLVEANPTLIHFDEVVDVVNYDFSGHVYDFTSLTGTNIVNNIYTSNCRCALIAEVVR